jgi:hypothetical protein
VPGVCLAGNSKGQEFGLETSAEFAVFYFVVGRAFLQGVCDFLGAQTWFFCGGFVVKGVP